MLIDLTAQTTFVPLYSTLGQKITGKYYRNVTVMRVVGKVVFI
jgi:hypothetical protein